MGDYPDITIGIVVLNREWIIQETIKSILSQTYPLNFIHFVIVDGGSIDRTVAIVQDGFKNLKHEIIIKKGNIPFGRNICIDRMKGEVLVFWDSDEILPPNALEKLVMPIISDKADIVTTSNSYSIKLNHESEIPEAVNQFLKGKTQGEKIAIDLGMGHTAISKKVLTEIRFDETLNWGEDADFIFRAIDKGFRYVDAEIAALDINLGLKKSSLLYSLKLKENYSAIFKKVKILGYIYLCYLDKEMLYFYKKNKRELFYMFYLVSIISFLYGIFNDKIFLSIFPLQLALHFFKTYGREKELVESLRIILKSMIFSMPFAYITLIILLKLSYYKIRKKHMSYSSL